MTSGCDFSFDDDSGETLDDEYVVVLAPEHTKGKPSIPCLESYDGRFSVLFLYRTGLHYGNGLVLFLIMTF